MNFNGIYVKIEFEVIKMNLYAEIISKILEQEEIQITFPNLMIDANELAEKKSYEALRQIKTIIQDDSLNDEECFLKIEQIVRVFEEIGSSGGGRHDFG